jgi:hypothetical protein
VNEKDNADSKFEKIKSGNTGYVTEKPVVKSNSTSSSTSGRDVKASKKIPDKLKSNNTGTTKLEKIKPGNTGSITEISVAKSNSISSSSGGKDVKALKKIPEVKSFKNSTALTPKEQKSELSSPVFVNIRDSNPPKQKFDLHYDTDDSPVKTEKHSQCSCSETISASPKTKSTLTNEKQEPKIASNKKDESEEIKKSVLEHDKSKKTKPKKRLSISSSRASSSEIESDSEYKKTKPKKKQNKRISISSSSSSSSDIPKRKKTVKKKEINGPSKNEEILL